LQNPLSLSVKLGNELQASDIPLLASPQGGVAASSRKFREATEADAAVFFLFVLNRKTTPSALPVDASHYFLSRAATPPCGDARRGISLARNSFTPLQEPLQSAIPSFATPSSVASRH